MAIGLFLIYLIFTLYMLERSEHSGIWEIGSGIYLFIASFLSPE